MMKIPALTEKDLAIWLANRKRKKVVKTDPPAVQMLHSFSAEKIFAALVDGKSPITLSWYVKRLMALLDDGDAKVSDRLSILDRLRDLLLVGAIQDPELARALSRRVSTGVPSTGTVVKMSDPFTKLKVRRA